MSEFTSSKAMVTSTSRDIGLHVIPIPQCLADLFRVDVKEIRSNVGKNLS